MADKARRLHFTEDELSDRDIRRAAKKAASAMWNVACGPWVVSGVCRVTTSARRATSSSETNPSHPSRSARGGSQRSTRQPILWSRSSTRRPTWPTPTMPTTQSRSGGSSPSRRSRSSEQATYCATLPALQPGQLVQPMPARCMNAVSIWSWPMVAVATNCTLLPPSRASSQRVRVRMMRASALRTSAAVIAAPGR